MTCPRDDASFTARIENDELIVDGCPPVMTKISNYYDGRVSYYTGPVYTLLPRTEEWGPAMKNDSILRFVAVHSCQNLAELHTVPRMGSKNRFFALQMSIPFSIQNKFI